MRQPDIAWEDYPYRSRRVPVLARNVVATSQPLAVQAGIHVLRQGGNAVDAAVAAAAALAVTEPCSNGLGADAFAIVWDGSRLHGLNGSGRSPRAWRPGRFTSADEFTLGWNSITVPGCVDAWSALSTRFGRLRFEQLLEPAIDYAQNGYPVSPTVHRAWVDAWPTYRAFDGFRRVFYPGGTAPAVGDMFRNTALAQTLRSIASSHGEDFYRGDIARRTADYLRRGGSALDEQDLAECRSEWVDPISATFGDTRLCEFPPNGQGIAALIALNVLRHAAIDEYAVDSVESVHLQIEAMKAAFALVRRHVADPAAMRVTVADLLDDGRLECIARSIRQDRAAAVPPTGTHDGGTVYLTTADSDGMMVSFIQSNFWGFGSGIVDPETGISFQNRAAGFHLDPQHANAVDGSKRPFHTIIPGFVMRGQTPVMSFGVMGGHMQAQGHIQMMVRIFCHGQNPQTASDAPRWFVDDQHDVVLEAGFDSDVRQALQNRGHGVQDGHPGFAFGGAQLIYRLDNGVYAGASDHRKDGHAAGY